MQEQAARDVNHEPFESINRVSGSRVHGAPKRIGRVVDLGPMALSLVSNAIRRGPTAAEMAGVPGSVVNGQFHPI
jgi:hypothetical protein